MVQFKQVKKIIVEKRDFSYSKGNVSLSFTLISDKESLDDFKSCLNEAVKDIDEILIKLLFQQNVK